MEMDSIPPADPLGFENRPKIARRHSLGITRMQSAVGAQGRPHAETTSAHSTDNDLSMSTTKSGSSSGGKRTRRSSNRSLDGGLTIEELSDFGDQGYDGDIEIVWPEGYDEAETEDESTAFNTPVLESHESNLTDRLRNLSVSHRPKPAQKKSSMQPNKFRKRSRKRGYSESFASDSGPETFDQLSDPSMRSHKRSKRTQSPEVPSVRLSPATSEGVHRRSEVAPNHDSNPDAMDVDTGL